MLRNLAGILAAAALVSGCASVEFLPAAPPPANYRYLAASYVAGLPPQDFRKDVLISALQKTEGAQPGDWFACLKFGNRSVYIIFFRGTDIARFRLPVGIDRCPVIDQPLSVPPKALPAGKDSELRA